MKRKLNSPLHSGFTLIELMIVIVILGILMGTILPRLSGAQARARDTARLADLNTIAQALELYYDDFGRYPGDFSEATMIANRICLRLATNSKNFEAGSAFRKIFVTYFKGGQVPQPPQGEKASFGDTNWGCNSGYLYLPLKRSATDTLPSGYALIGNMETPTKDNAIQKQQGVTYTIASIPVAAEFDYATDQTIAGAQAALEPVTPDLLIEVDQDDETGESTAYVIVN